MSDEQVFTATMRAMARLGPGELTPAEIAAEAGVTAGALVQRLGSERELLLALSRLAAEGGGDFLRGLTRRHRSPLAALREYAERFAHVAESPGRSRETIVARLARTVETALGGSLITWATSREGTAAAWLAHDVEAVVRPHRTA